MHHYQAAFRTNLKLWVQPAVEKQSANVASPRIRELTPISKRVWKPSRAKKNFCFFSSEKKGEESTTSCLGKSLLLSILYRLSFFLIKEKLKIKADSKTHLGVVFTLDIKLQKS